MGTIVNLTPAGAGAANDDCSLDHRKHRSVGEFRLLIVRYFADVSNRPGLPKKQGGLFDWRVVPSVYLIADDRKIGM